MRDATGAFDHAARGSYLTCESGLPG